MNIKKHFFEDNQKNFEDIMKAILESDINKIFDYILDESENHENNIWEVA